MGSLRSLVLLLSAVCHVSLAVYSTRPEYGQNPYPRSKYCSTNEQFYSWVQMDSLDCCSEYDFNGNECCNELSGLTYQGRIYYLQGDVKCKCQSASVSCPGQTTTAAPTTAQPTTEEPTTIEPTTLEPTTLAPTTEEPLNEEPNTEEPITEDPSSEEPTTVELTTMEPTTMEPTTLEPTTMEPTTMEPTTMESTTMEPTTMEPTTMEPTTMEPTTMEPTTMEPTTMEPTTMDPTTMEPTTMEPTTMEPTTMEPTTMDPTTMEPTTMEPTTMEPTTMEPTTMEPTTMEPTTMEPTTMEPTTMEPTTIEPTTMKPTTIEPTTVEPTTMEPTTMEPTTMEPTTIEPTTMEPTTMEPTTMEPTTMEPTTMEPTTMEPTTMEPTTVAPTTPRRITGTEDSLCTPLVDGNRLLGSTPVLNSCTYAGVASVGFYSDSTPDTILCNVVYTVATVSGRKQYALVTSQGCIDQVNLMTNNSLTVDLKIADYLYPIPAVAAPVDGSNGIGYLTYPSKYNVLFAQLGCQEPACVYDSSMSDEIDYNDCKIVSFGAYNDTVRVTGELREVSVGIDLFCNPAVSETGARPICFNTKTGTDTICAADKGAPVYCKANSNGEDILIGVVGTMDETTCSGDGGEIGVIPIRSD